MTCRIIMLSFKITFDFRMIRTSAPNASPSSFRILILKVDSERTNAPKGVYVLDDLFVESRA